ncbi:MAG: hypothetical protein KC621_00950 [Myxococcales bacterium]|nr:hypothetical protein [Myxococcales bacterium]
MVTLLSLLSVASAKPPSWFRDGAKAVRLDAAQVDVDLLRGPTTHYLPSVMATVPVGEESRSVLTILDLAGGPCRIDPATVRALGLSPSEDADGAWLVLDRVAVGGVALSAVRVRVDEGAPGFVLGIQALPEVAVALLPSAGKVRFVPSRGARALLEAVGPTITAERSSPRDGDGLTLRVPGALRWGPALSDGTFHLRTDLFASRIAPSVKLPSPTQRGGLPYHDVGTQLGEVSLPDTWIRVDRSIEDPDPAFVGALAYDVLFAVDLAVDPSSGAVAFRTVPQWTPVDSTGVTVAAARERYQQEEQRAKGTPNATGAPIDARATIGFDGPVSSGFALGEPGNPIVRDRNLQLADTLWAAGLLEEALPRYLSAAQYAGDHCGAHLALGERRMAWAGADRVDKDLVAKLVEDPLAQAALTWDAWTALDEADRARIAAGEPMPPGSLAVAQPDTCRVVWGLLHRVQTSRGRPEVAARIAEEHPRDPAVAWARVLDMLDEGLYGPADAMLPRAEGGADPLDLLLSEVRIAGGNGKIERAEELARQVPGAVTDHPLVAGLVVYEGASHTRLPQDIVRRMVRVDARWVPGQVAVSLATGQRPPAWDAMLEHQRPGDPLVTCQMAAHLAVSGEVERARMLLRSQRFPAEPDWWAATALVEHLDGHAEARDAALRELKLRFPWLPVTDLGLRDPPAP